MTQLMVCNRWPLELLPGTGGHYEWYQTKASGHNPECMRKLIEGLPVGMSVAEHFGGIGEISTVIQQTLRPTSHWISDLDKDCVAQLTAAFPHAQVSQNDAHNTMGMIQAEFVSLDFPYFTARYLNDWPWEELLMKIRPRYVQFADCGKRRIGLHRHAYAEKLGVDFILGYPDYVKAFSDHMSKNYGYRITKTVSQVYSYHLMEAE